MEVKHCRAQHKLLRSFIQYTLQNWGPWDTHPLSYWIDHEVDRANHPSRIQVTPEVKLVLARARVLSEECCTSIPPLRAALLHGERSQAFTDILKELQWCVSVVSHGHLCRNVTNRSAPELREFPWDAKVGQHEQLMLKEAEQEDWQNLKQKLEDWSEDHECSAEECGNAFGRSNQYFCLATQMLKEWSAHGSKSNDSDHLCKLWSFDEIVLKYGRPLGSGSFGSVIAATWMGNMYALKKFNSPERFLEPEAEALSKLNHPHIVKVHACSDDSLLLDVMSTDLQKFIKTQMQERTRDQPFSLPAAIDLMLQIADAVSYSHSQGMVHRDLKSANILVDPMMLSGEDAGDHGYVFAKVADFGLAKVKHEVTRYSHLTSDTGTRAYMAPEIFKANRDDVRHLECAYPMKADVYSFGVICSEILTRLEPFKEVPLSFLYKNLTNPFPLRPQLPASCPTSLVSLVHSCWDGDPRERPTFVNICRVLRYIKGTMREVEGSIFNAIDGTWPFGRLSTWMRPLILGANIRQISPISQPTFNSLPVMDIRGIQVYFVDSAMQDLLGFAVIYSSGGKQPETRSMNFWPPYKCRMSEDSVTKTDLIKFDYPSEYLVQVEGSCIDDSVSSLSFITTLRKYGPYGKVDTSGSGKWLTRSKVKISKFFSTSRGRVVGFTWGEYRDYHIEFPNFCGDLCVYVIEDITKCMHHFLSDEWAEGLVMIL